MPEENEKIVVTRIDKSLRTRLSNLADKNDTTIVALLNKSVDDYLAANEYNFQDLLKEIENNDSLRIHKELIEREVGACPNQICKDLIDIIRNREVQLFQEDFESIGERVKKIETNNMLEVFVILKIREYDVNKINNILSKFKGLLKNDETKIKFATNISENERVLVFVSYKKESGENG